jgi:methionine-rich copper-binding protein CopC
VAAVLGSLVLLVNPTPAFAHADVHASSPRNGAQLKVAPKSIVITFSEDVTLGAKAPTILGNTGAAVASTSAINGPRLTVTPLKPLGRGVSTVTWHVVSDDGHPVAGAIAFTVGSSGPRGQRISLVTMPRVPTSLNGNQPGSLTVTMATTARSGEVEWTSPTIPEPIVWRISGNGRTAKASGVLPLPGVWTMVATLMTQNYSVIVVKGDAALVPGSVG